jgi:ABC-type uncharacterized transport system permease subunit
MASISVLPYQVFSFTSFYSISAYKQTTSLSPQTNPYKALLPVLLNIYRDQ